MKAGIALHGGAGTILKEELTPATEKKYFDALQYCLNEGKKALQLGASALDVVELTVKALEDCELFNAGKGAVFTHEGLHEMDACIMDGKSHQAGAVAGIKKVVHPVSLARVVMEKSDFVLLYGEGAEQLALEQGMEMQDPSWFDVEFRRQQWLSMRHSEQMTLDHNSGKMGTVGAVCLDHNGSLAAATSTGGMTNKRFQRIGDSPIPGAGTWAHQDTCAISCTGHGEFFIREVTAHQIHMRILLLGESLEQASNFVIHDKLAPIGGEGGLVSIDKDGHISMPFNSTGMYRAWCSENKEGVAIF